LIHKIVMLYGRNNSEYSYEFLLICIVRLFHKVLMRLNNLKNLKKIPIISPNLKVKLVSSLNKLKVGLLPDPQTFDRSIRECRTFDFEQKLNFELEPNKTTSNMF